LSSIGASALRSGAESSSPKGGGQLRGALTLEQQGGVAVTGASISSGGGDIALLSGGAMTLADLDALNASDASQAGNLLIASSASVSQRSSAAAWRAKDLVVRADSSVSALSTAAERLAIEVGQGNIIVTQSGDLVITSLAQQVVREFSAQGLDAYSRDAGAMGLRTGSGGGLSLNVAGSLSLLAQDAQDLGLLVKVGSGGASIVVTGADHDLLLDADLRVAGTLSLTVSGDIDQAQGRSIQADGAVSLSAGGHGVLASVQAGAVDAALAHTAAAAVHALSVTAGGEISSRVGRAPVLVADDLTVNAATVSGVLRVAADRLSADISGGGLSLMDVDAAAGSSPGLDCSWASFLSFSSMMSVATP
jgi:hypothetical protein